MAESKAVEYEEEEVSDWANLNTQKEKEETKIEYELEQDDPQEQAQENEEQAQESKEQEKPQVQEKTETPELNGIETSGAQKRIRQLIKQRKEREDKISELERRISDYESKLRQKDTELLSSFKNNLDSNEIQLQEQIKLAENAYRRALEGGEADEIILAQRLLNKAEFELSKLSDTKHTYENYQRSLETNNEQPVQAQAREQVQTPNPADYDPKAVEWAMNNSWFGQDQLMTAAALAIDAQLKDEGFDPSDDEFYSEVDARLRNSFPNKFQVQAQVETEEVEQQVNSEPKASVKQPSQVVSGASRTVTNPSTNRSNRIKLTKRDIEMANRWGIPLERYAEQKLIADQADGEYTTVLTKKRGG